MHMGRKRNRTRFQRTFIFKVGYYFNPKLQSTDRQHRIRHLVGGTAM